MNIERLRQAVILKRRRAGLSLSAVQEACGVSDSTIGRFERGLHEPEPDTLGRLAAWVGLSLSELNGEPEPQRSSGDALESIEGLLRGDPKLRPADADGLMTILRTAYERAVKG